VGGTNGQDRPRKRWTGDGEDIHSWENGKNNPEDVTDVEPMGTVMMVIMVTYN